MHDAWEGDEGDCCSVVVVCIRLRHDHQSLSCHMAVSGIHPLSQLCKATDAVQLEERKHTLVRVVLETDPHA